MRDLRDLFDVDDVEVGVGRAFEKEGLGVRPHRALPLRKIGAVDQGRGNAVTRQEVFHHIAARAEQRLRGNHMIAGLELPEQRHGDRRHAGRRCARGLRAFERRHPLFEHRDRGIGEARVLVTRVLILEAPLGLRGELVDIALRQEQRLGGFAELRAQRAGVHQARLGPEAGLRRMHGGLLTRPTKNPAEASASMPGRGSRASPAF